MLDLLAFIVSYHRKEARSGVVSPRIKHNREEVRRIRREHERALPPLVNSVARGNKQDVNGVG